MERYFEKLDRIVRSLFPRLVPDDARANGFLNFFLLTRLIIGVGGLAALPPMLVAIDLNRTAWLVVMTGLAAQFGAGALAASAKPRFELAYALSLAGLASAASAFSGHMGLLALTPLVLEAGLMLNRRIAFGTAGVLAIIIALTLSTDAWLTAINPLSQAAFLSTFLFALVTTGIGVAAMLYHLNERERAYYHLQSSSTALIEAVDCGIATVDARGEISGPSVTLIHMTGLPHHALVGGQFLERLHLLSRPAYLKAVSDALHSDQPVKTRIKVKCRIDGDDVLYRDFDLSVRAMDHNAPFGERQAIISLSEAKIEEALPKQARDPLYEAQLRHELKTPLNAILGFAEILCNPALVAEDDPRRHDYIRIIATSARHLVDILDHMKASADAGETEQSTFEAVKAEALIAEALSMLKRPAEESLVIIDQQIEDGLPELIGQRHGLRQIIINLVSNAVKYAPEGRVVIAAEHHHSGVQLSVSDDGIGMADQELLRVGEPYFRGTAGTSGFADGEGLGLAVVYGLVARYGGQLTIESAPGNGTTVRVVFTHVRTDSVSNLHRLADIDAGQSPLPVNLPMPDLWRRKSA